MKNFGSALRAARKAKRMTLQALADQTGLSFGYLGRIERGLIATPPSERAIRNFARILQIDPTPFLVLRDEFFSRDFGPFLQANPDLAAAPEMAALGEQAFRSAEDLFRRDHIEGARQMADLALSFLRRSDRPISVGRTAHLVATIDVKELGYRLRGGDVRQSLNLRARAIDYYSQSVAAFETAPQLSADEAQKWVDGIAQAARMLSGVEALDDGGIVAFHELCRDSLTELLRLAEPKITPNRALEEFLEERRDMKRDDYQPLITSAQSILEVSKARALRSFYRLVTAALFDVAAEHNEQLREELLRVRRQIQDEIAFANATINLANVLSDLDFFMNKKTDCERSKSLLSDLIVHLKKVYEASIASDKPPIKGRIHKAHQELGWLLDKLGETKRAAWQFVLMLKLDPTDALGRRRHIEVMLEEQSEDGKKEYKRLLSQFDSLVSDEDLNLMRYPIEIAN